MIQMSATVNHRFSDILREFITQRLLWEDEHYPGFMKANVFQKRNPHDLVMDFADKTDMYLKVENVVSLLNKIHLYGDMNRKLRLIYQELYNSSIVDREEL